MITDEKKLHELLTRGVEEVIDKDHLTAALRSKRKLRIKLGIDPTSPNIHIGRAGALWKLRAFQDLGHKVIFIVGDFTAVIGDTSDKESERPMMSEQDVKKNIKAYFKQAAKIIDPQKAEMHYNSTWLKKLGFHEIGRMANAFGLHEFESRENISKRMKAGKRVSLRELLYPIMQGYDSVAIKADVEIGGTDQRFNLLAGRTIQPLYGQPPQDILTRTLMEGTDGRKMSSSWGNVITVIDEPKDMFGKIMSIRDEIIISYFTLATLVSMEEISAVENALKNGANPRDAKMRLAEEIVTLYHGKEKAAAAKENFIRVFQKKENPDAKPVYGQAGAPVVDLLIAEKIVSSKSDWKRLVEGNAVEINGEAVKEPSVSIQGTQDVRIGKHRFIKIVAK